MKNFISLIVIATSFFAVSCSKEMENNEDARIKDFILGASLEQQLPQTRTSLTNNLSVIWTAGDKLSVLSSANSTGGDEFTLKTGAGEVSGTFEGTLSTGAEQYYAVYPYSSTAKIDGDDMVLTIPEEQDYVANSFANNANVSVAVFSESTADQLSFKNVFGVFELRLKGTNTYQIESILLSDHIGNYLNGTASIKTSSLSSGFPVATLKDGTSRIKLNCGGVTLDPSTPTSFFFVVPVGAFASGFDVRITCSDGKRYLYSFKDNSIVRSKVLYMPAISLSDPAFKEVDLDDEGRANCYIVSSTSECSYSFDATIRGNELASTLEPKSACVLWSTDNTLVAPGEDDIVKNIDLKYGRVTFTATGKAGNAVIAVKDSESKILWSWHIWCVSGIQHKGPRDGMYIMDRNLGALTTDSSLGTTAGLWYQWGRKDPFEAFITGTQSPMSYYGVESTYNSEAVSIDYSIAHPREIIAVKCWKTDEERYLWSNAKKTVYDPCPVGYRVMSKSFFEGADFTGEWNRGRTITYKETPESPSIDLGFYPMQGGIYQYSPTIGKGNSQIWIWMTDMVTTLSVNILNSTNKGTNFQSNPIGNLFAVRCVKE